MSKYNMLASMIEGESGCSIPLLFEDETFLKIFKKELKIFWARARAHKMSILSNLAFLQKRRASSVRFVCTERRAECSHMSPKTAESVVFEFLYF